MHPAPRLTLSTLALIWGLAAALLGVLIPLVAVAPGMMGLAIALIGLATTSTILLQRSPAPAKLPAALERRLQALEAQCTRDNFAPVRRSEP